MVGCYSSESTHGLSGLSVHQTTQAMCVTLYWLWSLLSGRDERLKQQTFYFYGLIKLSILIPQRQLSTILLSNLKYYIHIIQQIFFWIQFFNRLCEKKCLFIFWTNCYLNIHKYCTIKRSCICYMLRI